MALLRGGLIAIAAIATTGCTLALDYEECTSDDDCNLPGSTGPRHYCTSDHLCIGQVPTERLCIEPDPAPAPGSFILATMTNRETGDLPLENAVVLAVEEINKNGSLQPKIALYRCLSGDQDTAKRVAQQAIELYHATAIVGPTTSDAVTAIVDIVRRNHVLVISPSATATGISSLQDDYLVWRVAPSDDKQAQELVPLLLKDVPMPKDGTVDILHENTVYAQNLANKFYSAYTTQPMLSTATVRQNIGFAGSTDLMDALMKLDADRPDQALLVADLTAPEMVAKLSQFKVKGLGFTRFYMTDSAQYPTLFSDPSTGLPNDTNVLQRIRGTGPHKPSGSAYQNFANAYKSRFPEIKMEPADTAWTAHAYDAAYLVGLALGAVTSSATDPVPGGDRLATALREKILPYDMNTKLAIGPENYIMLVSRVHQGGTALEGTSGPIQFDMAGDSPLATFDYWTINFNSAVKPESWTFDFSATP